MKKDQLFLSTIAPDAAEEARRHGLGLEIANTAPPGIWTSSSRRPTPP